MSRAVASLILCSCALLAQDPSRLFQKAPPEVEQALRERIKKFYQLHVDGKFRQAEALVAEDTKDFFYTAKKPRYLSFEIGDIEWQDDYTRARVTMLCEQPVMFPGFQGKAVKIPEPSRWKLEEDQWVWYVDLKEFRKTPFGELKEGEPSQPRAAPQMPDITVDAVRSMVKADKNSVELKSDNCSDQVTIVNQMPGVVTLRVEAPKVKGFVASLDRRQLKQGEKALLTLKCEEKAALGKGLVVTVRVAPISAAIPIKVL